MNVRAIWLIFQKDLQDAFKNLYILFGLVLPVGMSLLFGLIFPKPGDLETLTVVVYDPGPSRLVENLRTLPQVKLIEAASAEALPEQVTKNAVGGLVVPEGFDAALQAGAHPELAVSINRGRGGGEIARFQQLIQEQVWALSGQQAPVQVVWNDLARQPGGGVDGDFRLDHLILIMLLVVALSMTGSFVIPTLLVEEKEKHTLDALLLSPAGPAEVAAGKALTGMVYGLLVSAILLTMNSGWEGNWPVTLLALVLGGLFIVGVGLLMGAFFRTTNQVNTWSSALMLALMVPSWFGAFSPGTIVESAFRWVPTSFLVSILRLSLAGEAAFGQIWDELALLLGSVLLVFAAVVWVLRRQE